MASRSTLSMSVLPEQASFYKGEVPLIYRRRVRWGDSDPARIAYTVRFVDYAMEAIEEWFIAVLDIDWYRLNVNGSGAPVVHLEFDFVSPLVSGDIVLVEVLIEEIGGSTITFSFTGYSNTLEQKSFSGKIVSCIIDSTGERAKAKAIPKDYRARIEQYVAASTR